MFSKRLVLIASFICLLVFISYWWMKHLPADASSSLDDMVFIPPGKFIMGTDQEEFRILKDPYGYATKLVEPRKRRVVNLKGFYIDKYEVTNRQYKKFVDDTGYRLPDHWLDTGTYPEGEGDYPVTFVTWWDAKAYAQWAGKRLPTEEEWEKAARGTDGRIFPWGKEFDKTRANTWEAGLKRIHRVGQYESGKSPYGVYDLAGNVMEWTATEYRQYQHLPGEQSNEGQDFWYTKVIVRGGAWSSDGKDAQVFSRVLADPGIKSNGIGFRCAKDG
jgi:iron(II)-dependent oxidoreductase